MTKAELINYIAHQLVIDFYNNEELLKEDVFQTLIKIGEPLLLDSDSILVDISRLSHEEGLLDEERTILEQLVAGLLGFVNLYSTPTNRKGRVIGGFSIRLVGGLVTMLFELLKLQVANLRAFNAEEIK